MCGIAGIISKNDDVSEIIKLLNKNIKHRGPDDDAYYINKALNIALTSTRLSIIGINSFGIAFVAGRNLVPNPATGNTAFVTFCIMLFT